jgi:DNA-binding GntR family transcriptional regulator
MNETSLALLKFLGIDPQSGVTRVEIVAVPDDFPVVTVTRLLDHSIWDNETRMFKLVPYSTPE